MAKNSDIFTVHLVSSASMDLFPSNTLSSFRNYLSEALNLDGTWAVALTEITFPSNIYNVSDTKINVYESNEESGNEELSDVVVRRRVPKTVHVRPGCYASVIDLLIEIQNTSGLDMEYNIDDITQKLTLIMKENEGLTFSSQQIPALLGLSTVEDTFYSGRHVGYKTFPYLSENTHRGIFPIDMTNGVQFAFVYIDIIDFQHLGDTKAPLLKVIDTDLRLKNGSVCSIEPTHKKVFSNLEYKKLLTNTIRSIKVELRTETGQLVPFAGTGKVLLTLQFRKIS